MRWFPDRWLCRRAAVGALMGALALALCLAGCGRKGGLEPPPSAAAVDPTVAAPAPERAPEPDAGAPAKGPQRRTPLDWLID